VEPSIVRPESRPDVLSRKIELCRQYLSRGVDANTASTLLGDILQAEIELGELLKLLEPNLSRCRKAAC
jgi:hypothetical protein